ncbi:Gfo/Idh/MocA family protein [Jiangella endophytica]|uniref:Gfo/Idh/MocA family protein n=1 Tax=Jiangella endophytica TaxID=1623398 RepID=UPI000E357D6D|nr:Gfo/Idh/MocA family oxidoreductase [Jiangella endophytica]
MAKTTVALVGLGAIGVGAHLPALRRHPDVDLTGLVDVDAARRDHAAALVSGGVPTFASLDDLPAVDAVVVATPPWVTPVLARRALERGSHVLVEKPVATSVAEATRILDLPRELLDRLQVGLTYRHDPAIAQLKTWVEQGRLGSGPLLVRAHIYDEVRDESDATHLALIGATLEHGSPALHEGSHVFDWLSHVLGAEGRLEDSWAVRTAPGLAAPNLVGGRLLHPNGTQVLVEFGWFTAALPPCELTFVGDAATVRLDGRTFDLTITDHDGEDTVRFEGERVPRSFDRQLDAFVRSVRAGSRRLTPSWDDGLRALAASEALDRRVRETPATVDGGRWER